MRSLKKYKILFALLVSSSVYSQAQDVGFHKTDSVKVKSGWRTDSARIANNFGETEKHNEPYWKIDSARLIVSNVNIAYDIDEYIPNLRADEDLAQVKVGGIATFTDGDYAPFWITNNQHGIGSIQTNNQYLRVGAFGNKSIKASDEKFNMSGGVDVLIANNLSSDFYIQQLYSELAYKATVLSVGIKERYSLFKNRELSSGGLALSNNARPIPQVEFAIPRFVSIPGTDHKWQIMGGLSYGWFLDNDFKRNNAANGYYATDVLYHRKYGFLKFRPNEKWSFIGGLEMDTQWGGHFYKKGEYWGKSSAKLKDIFKVLIPMSGGSDSNITDKVNITGNVYGSIHMIANYRNSNIEVKAYHEHFFEDHSGLLFKNIPDGLYGVELHFKKQSWISDLLIEYLHTKDQSGPFLWDKTEEIPVQVSGGDNYYNQVDYISLTNYGYVIGNPLFVSPIYNDGSSLTVYNTRLSSFHFGIAGNISSNVRYKTLLTYSRSWGTPLIPSVNIRDQFSSLLEVIYKNTNILGGWCLSGAVAYDKSQMIGDNFGGQFKLFKTFNIR